MPGSTPWLRAGTARAQGGALWEEVVRHGGIALHVAGDFPSLELELWGVRA